MANNSIFPWKWVWILELIPDSLFQMKDLDLVEDNVKNLYKYLNEKYRNKSFLSMGAYPFLIIGIFM